MKKTSSGAEKIATKTENDADNIKDSERINCVQAVPAAMYSASAVDKETQFCFLLNQEIRLFSRKKQPPKVLFLSSEEPTQSASQYPTKVPPQNTVNYPQGNRTSPSYVAFIDSERLIGDAAKNQVAMNPNNARSCSYTVTIKRSCSSPAYTRDYISIAFGDAYGNQACGSLLLSLILCWMIFDWIWAILLCVYTRQCDVPNLVYNKQPIFGMTPPIPSLSFGYIPLSLLQLRNLFSSQKKMNILWRKMGGLRFCPNFKLVQRNNPALLFSSFSTTRASYNTLVSE
uniref:Uncharacterized protein n=1 Tax=Cucumis melo TaxID=3656 RepID=A0A9I9EEK3_CUCME